MIVAIVKAKILPNKHETLREIALILQNEFAPNEEGCEQYESFIDGDTFITIERWSNQDLLDLHLKQEHVATYVPKMKECIENHAFDVQFIKGGEITFLTL